MKRLKLRKWVVILLIIISLLGIIYSSYHIILWHKSVNENEQIKNEINKKINIFKHDDYDEYAIDFEYLKEQNYDTVAYIKVNNTNIDYVVVKGNDNSYYLTHNFLKSYSIAGWIFADYHNKFDNTDKNIIIYGHNTVDGTMFGSLKNTTDKSWQDNQENHIITLVTEQGTLYYEILSTYVIAPEDYYINTYFSSDDEFMSFLNELKSRSNYNYNVSLDKDDTILTLSTCAENGKKRVVLHAKKIPN